MEYRVGLGWKNMEKWEKNIHSKHFSVTCTGTVWVLVVFGQPVSVQVRAVPVQVVFCFLFRLVFVF